MGAAKYNRRIQVYRPDYSPSESSSLNEPMRTDILVASPWAHYDTNPGSSLLFPRGRETFVDIKDLGETRFIFVVRYLGDSRNIRKTDRLIFEQLNYDITYTKQLFRTKPSELEIHVLLKEDEAGNP